VQPADGATGPRLLRAAEHLGELARAVDTYNATMAGISLPRVLARGVRSLTAHLDQQQRAVELSITIEQQTDAHNPKPDVITSTFYVKPHNTVPVD
jgi:hypothetical protein